MPIGDVIVVSDGGDFLKGDPFIGAPNSEDGELGGRVQLPGFSHIECV
jgi:hypothetical protein